MIETSLNMFDLAVLVVLGFSSLFAFFRGFVREILSLGAWVGAGIVTIYFFPSVAEQLQPKFKSAVVAAGFATLGIYICALIGFSMINMLILKFVKSGSDVGLLDNWLGLVFGVFRGAFMVSLGFFLLTIVLPENEYPAWVKKSISMPYVEKGALALAKISPEYLREISTLTKKLKKEGEARKSLWSDEAEKDGALQKGEEEMQKIIDQQRPKP